MQPYFDESELTDIGAKRPSAAPESRWEQMMADSQAHLTQAQRVLEELAKGVLGPVSAVMSCVEACHSVAVALVVLADAATYVPKLTP